MRQLSGRTKGLIALALLVLVAILGFAVRKQKATTGQFFTSVVDMGPLKNVVNATGVVQTVVTVQVGSQVSGQVDELYADYNSVVKHGQLLAKLDPRNFQAQLENAEAAVASAEARVQSADADMKTQTANLASAKANLEAARVTRDNNAVLFQRNAELNKDGVVSKNDYDNAKANADSAVAKYDQGEAAVAQAEAQTRSAAAGFQQAKAQLQQAQADLNRAKLNLEYCNIYSPVDGVVISRNVDVGQTIAASLQSPTLFTIANDLARMQVNANVDEADIGNISDQADVRFTVDAFPNDSFKGQISEIRLNLEYCNIYSPVDGVVISRNVDVGQTIAASLQSPTLFTIANDLARMQVNANVDEADIGNISDQADVRFTVDAFPNDSFKGQISEIRLNPQTVQNVVTYSVIIGINNPDLKLKPGMTANIAITVDQRERVLKVSNAALRYTPPGTQREQPVAQAVLYSQPEKAQAPHAGKVQEGPEPAAPPLAPGQKWNPSQKIKMVPPKRNVQRPGIVYVLNAQQMPEPRRVVLGITDGTATEVVSGELNPGDAVIIGDTTRAASIPAPNAPAFGGPFGGGGGGVRGRGN